MNKLDKELEELISQASSYDWQNTDYDKILANIKTVILEALIKEIEKRKAIQEQLASEWTGVAIPSGFVEPINPHTEKVEAIQDCLNVCNKLLGDSNE